MSKLKDASEDAEDHEIFDINDFTTASDWERYKLSKDHPRTIQKAKPK